QNHLLGPGFTYDASVDYRQDPNAILDFLTRTRTGMCEQFAGSMALLVRELGLPARVAVGYRPGNVLDPRHPNTYTVTTEQYHAWVEVLFPGYGWIAFEPTKGFSNPVAEASYLSSPSAACAGRGCGSPTGAGGSKQGSGRGLGGHERKHNVGP